MADLVRLCITMEPDLYARLERLLKENAYDNRSEFFRDLIRDRLVELEWERDEEVVGSITFLYNHHAPELSQKLIELQHHHQDHTAILATTHVHLDHDLCSEVIIARGRAKSIRGIANQIRLLKGVYHATLSISTTGEQLL